MKFQNPLSQMQKKMQEKSDKIQQKIKEFQQQIEKGPGELFSPLSNTALSNTAPQKKSKLEKQIIRCFYSDYPEKPYISPDRPKKWIEQANMFPKQSIIPKSIMTRYADGLLPGHVYMLFWLKKYTNKKVPAYFEYKYGIDFEREKVFLAENGFLNAENKPTAKGESAIKRHYKIIENHRSEKPDRSIEGISKQIIKSRNEMLKDGISEYEYIANSKCCDVCRALNGKHFPISELKIGVNAPPMHEGCRCAITPYEDEAEYQAWLSYIAHGGTTKKWEALKRKKTKK